MKQEQLTKAERAQWERLDAIARAEALESQVADLKARLKAARNTRSTDTLARVTDLRVKDWRKP